MCFHLSRVRLERVFKVKRVFFQYMVHFGSLFIDSEDVLPSVHADKYYPCELVGTWNTWYGEQDQAGRIININITICSIASLQCVVCSQVILHIHTYASKGSINQNTIITLSFLLILVQKGPVFLSISRCECVYWMMCLQFICGVTEVDIQP